jgi:WD40 repeat protein/serine/threonine protein kinase
MIDLTGKSIGKYKVVSRLDRGAMGEVYRGYHTILNRNVAIKVLHSHLASAADFVERFKREAAVVARLRHTNIMQVYDFDVLDDFYYMVMEFIEGPTLKKEFRERQQNGRPFTFKEIGYIAHSLGAALDYAHVRGVIHRDIKPANVMFNAEGQIVLTDFGIVHMVGDVNPQEAGKVMGTPAYMAPEQALGEVVTGSSDIYAFGIVLYELITGQIPFTGDTSQYVISQHVTAPVPPPRQFRKDIPPELEHALLQALQKKPYQRPQKASDLARDIQQALGMAAEPSLAYMSIATLPPASSSGTGSDISKIGGDTNLTMISPAIPGNTEAVRGVGPYRGLFAFREEHARFFFGREEFTEQLLEKVKEQPLIAVVGPSGSGKSSVVFAGLVAALRREGNWAIDDFRPGHDPFQTMAGTLVPLLNLDLTAEQKPRAIKHLAQELRNNDRRLHEIIQQILNSHPPDSRLLLVVDQFEEVFTLCEDEALRHHFMDQLIEAVDIQKFKDKQRFSLVLTLRADFLGQALAYRPFANALQDADVKLGPMSRQDLVRAIANPARRLDVTFEPGLVMRIVGDVGDEPGNLPLLEFALSALWGRRQGNQITHEAYVEIGGVTGALARHANEIYANLSPEEQRLARRAFVQMVQPGTGTEDTRRVATRNELTEEEWQLVQKLANERLVVTSVDESGLETVEVVHEALIRGWDLLREWMTADRSFRAWQERLRSSMNQWQGSGRDEGALLRGTPLQQALDWAASDTIILSSQERSFIEVSQDAVDKAEQEKEAQRQRELEQANALSESRRRQVRVVRFASIGLTILLILAMGAAVLAIRQRGLAQANAVEAETQATIAFVAQETAVANEQIAATRAVEAEVAQAAAEDERQEAENQRALAEAARAEAELERAEAVRQGQIALAQSLVSLSQNTVEQTNDRELAALLALEAARLNETANGNIEWYIDSAVRPLVGQPYFNTTILGGGGSIRAVAFSPDGRWLAFGNADNTVRLLEWGNPAAEPIILTGHEGPVLAVGFSPDGRLLVSGSEDDTLRIWLMEELEQPPVIFAGHTADVLSLVVTPDERVISSSLDNIVRSWDLAALSAEPEILLEQSRPVLGLALSEDGQSLALANDDGTVQLYNLADNSTAAVGQHDSSVIAAAFSPDQSRLATGSVDNSVRVWNLAEPGSEPLIFEGHTSSVRGLVFLSDGRRLISGADDQTIRVWDLDNPESAGLVLPGHESRVRSLVLSPDGLFVASANDDQTIRLWQVETLPEADRALTGHEASVLAVLYSADGSTMFSSGADNNVRLWDTTDYAQTGLLAGHTGRVRALDMAEGRNMLASAGDDSTIRLWDLGAGAETAVVLEGHTGSVRAVRFSSDEQILYSAGDDGLIRAWDMNNPTAEPTVLAMVEGPIFSMILDPAGERLVAGGGDGRLYIWSLADPGAAPVVLEGHSDRVNDLAVSPDGRFLASASEDWSILLRQWADPTTEPTLLTGHLAGVRGLAFSPDGSQLVSTGQDTIVLVWNPDNPTFPPAVLNGHTAAIIKVAFAPDQSNFATVSDDATIRLWRPLAVLTDLACQLVRRNLTQQEWNTLLAGEPYHATCPGFPDGE